MARACTICIHDDHEAIDSAIIKGRPNRAISRQYGLSKDAIARHAEGHLSRALMDVQRRRDERGQDRIVETLVDRVEGLWTRTNAILDEVEDRPTVALAAVRELRAIAELLGKLTHELDSSPNVNVLNIVASEDWWRLRDSLLAALPDDPNQRAAVVRRLRELDPS